MITSPKREVVYDFPDDGTYTFCDWCDTPVATKAIRSKRSDAGTDDTGTWCSDICRQIVSEGKWPSPVGPATHDEMVVWMAEAERIEVEQAEAVQAAIDGWWEGEMASLQDLIEADRLRIQAAELPIIAMDELTADQIELSGRPRPPRGNYSGEVVPDDAG